MPLTQEQKKQYKSIGHHLKPVLTVARPDTLAWPIAKTARATHQAARTSHRNTSRQQTASNSARRLSATLRDTLINSDTTAYSPAPPKNSVCNKHQPPTRISGPAAKAVRPHEAGAFSQM